MWVAYRGGAVMRRTLWVGFGMAIGAAAPRWVSHRVRRRLRRAEEGRAVSVLDTADAVGTVTSVVGRAAARAAEGSARRVHGHVLRALEGGRADAQARERQLHRALFDRPSHLAGKRQQPAPRAVAPPDGQALPAGGAGHRAR